MLLLAAQCCEEGSDSWWGSACWCACGCGCVRVSRLILQECGLCVCVGVFLPVRCTVGGTEPVLFGPAGRLVFEGVTQHIAAVTRTARTHRASDLDLQPAFPSVPSH